MARRDDTPAARRAALSDPEKNPGHDSRWARHLRSHTETRAARDAAKNRTRQRVGWETRGDR